MEKLNHVFAVPSFELTPEADPFFMLSLLSIGASIASGLLATTWRLVDSCYSTGRARMRDIGEDFTERRRFARYRRVSNCLGFCSWPLFVFQTVAFGTGAVLLGDSIAISKGLLYTTACGSEGYLQPRSSSFGAGFFQPQNVSITVSATGRERTYDRRTNPAASR